MEPALGRISRMQDAHSGPNQSPYIDRTRERWPPQGPMTKTVSQLLVRRGSHRTSFVAWARPSAILSETSHQAMDHSRATEPGTFPETPACNSERAANYAGAGTDCRPVSCRGQRFPLAHRPILKRQTRHALEVDGISSEHRHLVGNRNRGNAQIHRSHPNLPSSQVIANVGRCCTEGQHLSTGKV